MKPTARQRGGKDGEDVTIPENQYNQLKREEEHVVFLCCFISCLDCVFVSKILVILYMVSLRRQVASVAGSATICASCNKLHSKGTHATFTPVLSGSLVMIIIMSFFIAFTKSIVASALSFS